MVSLKAKDGERLGEGFLNVSSDAFVIFDVRVTKRHVASFQTL